MDRTNAKPTRGLRAVRVAKGLSQEALEAASGVQQRTISKLETATSASRAVLNALRLAKALGTTVEELFGHALAANTSTSVRTRRRAPADPTARSRDSAA